MTIARRAAATAAAAIIAGSFAGWPANASAPSTSGAARCAPEDVGTDSFCLVNGLRLHYVDWGGRGPAIVLLAGLGDSARIFDDFAPLLGAGHRVIAVTRRGYGLSAPPADSDYSNAALVSDVLGLMDALGMDRASFVGHSIAGGELAALGERHEERVERLVYIDAAYDRERALEIMSRVPPLPAPDDAIRADFDRLAQWRQSVLGADSPAVAQNLSQILVREAEGWAPRTPSAVGALVLAGDIASKARWDAIRAPSLAFYSSKDVADQVPPTASDAQRQAMIDNSIRFIRPWMLRAQADFTERSTCASAIEVARSTHYLFLEYPQWMSRSVLAFLADGDPCRWRAEPPPAGKP